MSVDKGLSADRAQHIISYRACRQLDSAGQRSCTSSSPPIAADLSLVGVELADACPGKLQIPHRG